MAKRRAGQGSGNAVADVVARFEGKRHRVGAAADVDTATVSRWMAKGSISDSKAVLRIAAALEPDDAAAQLRLARRLAGLEP